MEEHHDTGENIRINRIWSGNGLVKPEDKRYTINRLLELFALDELEDEVVAAYEKRTPMTQDCAEAALEGILTEMLDYAAEQG